VRVADSSIRLGTAPDAVPRARRFVAEALNGRAPEAVIRTAELVVTELATNAVMHVGPPVVVSVSVTPQVVRVEVADPSRMAPIQAFPGDEAMTGRGLGLVGALSKQWGVTLQPDGKIVWAEFATHQTDAADVGDRGIDADPLSLDAAAALTASAAAAALTASAASASAAPTASASAAPTASASTAAAPAASAVPVAAPTAEPRYRISLGDVPTDLLLAAKEHVDNIVREFTLLASGAAAGNTAAVSPHLARLIETVTTRFAVARRAIKRQAMAAAAAGEKRTRLPLALPVSAADAGEEYLAALDQADAYARAARLLTLESPPQHRAFRRWYVTSLVAQLRSAARGEPPVPTPTFEQHLLGELAVITTAQRATERTAQLQAVTASLARAATPEGVAQVVVSEGVIALGASGGGVLVPVDDEHVAVPGAIGYGEDLVERLRAERRDAELPAAQALRTGEPVWLESRQERDARFPALVGLEPTTNSMCAVPLIIHDRIIGALRFSFDAPRLFDDDERRFVLALAAQTAQALERSALYIGERQARASAEIAATRLARLQKVTAALAVASEVDEVADIAVAEAAQSLGATLTALCTLIDDQTLSTIRMHGSGPGVEKRWRTFPVAADLPASEAVRRREPVVTANREELERRFPALAGQVPDDRPLVCVPLVAGDRCFGALSLSFPSDHRVDDGEVQLLGTIGRQCALALERARLFAAERAARERTAFLANATELLTSSLEPAETLEHLTGLVVPALADWAVVYLCDENGDLEPTAFAHRDPAVAARIGTSLMNLRLDRQAPDGLAKVFRTGHSVCDPGVPGEILAGTLRGADYGEITEALAPRSGMGVALASPDRILGAIALARVTDGPFTDDDVRLLEAVAPRAAVAVDNAQQFGRERDAALTLQRSLLPQQLPTLRGMRFAWRYLPGAAGTHIGGDWYDVIPLERGRVALVIGDVMGRGLQAAAVMGQLRATARAYASAQLGPGEVLERLDQAVARLEQAQITTAAFGVLDPINCTLTIASAGHLPPLVTGPHIRPYYIDVEPAPPLGVGLAKCPELTVALPENATLLLFTDGLVEDRNRPVDKGLAMLRVAASGIDEPELLCDRALAALGRDSEHDDDMAMLAVTLIPH
jgi:GAF domain-containing protein/anti-sigma regulatory factor (Ser/Thr protein kinase)